MTFRLNAVSATNEKRPGWNRGATVTLSTGRRMPMVAGRRAIPFYRKSILGRNQETCALPTYPRGPSSRPEGRAHRARLRQLLQSEIQVGARLPKSLYLGAILGVDSTQALRHLRRVLNEDGVTTETRLKGQRGIYVTGLGEGQP